MRSLYPRRGCTLAPPGGRLAKYVKHFATVEIDSTFYGAPRRSTVEKWREIVPEGFFFAAKFPHACSAHMRQQSRRAGGRTCSSH